MASIATGLLMCRAYQGRLEYFLVHPGGPFFQKKKEGSWTIPKGIPERNEELLHAACREFKEETGITPVPPYYALGSIKQKGGKTVHAWAFIGDWSPADGFVSNEFEMEWPPKSGRMQKFPEVDKAQWMDFELAAKMIKETQRPLLEKAHEVLKMNKVV